MNRQHGIEKIGESYTMRFRHKAKQRTITVKAPRTPSLADLDPGLIMTVKQLVRHFACLRLVG